MLISIQQNFVGVYFVPNFVNKKMNGLAFVVGNANYEGEHNKLINAVNDANDFSAKLLNLGFVVMKSTDCTNESFDRDIRKFSDELKKYDVGLFYFSGHGLQIEGKNYLTSIDTSFADSISAKHTSIPLDEVMDYMQQSKTIVKILILDACRNNPLPDRGINAGLAPIYAPKGTIIAFSTSPGETAMDYGAGRNSIYTGSLLNHIDDKNIPIEDFFKRVRTSVFTLSNGKQTSWEHTSLIGNFCFNSGQLIHSINLPYSREHIVDKDFISKGSPIDEIIVSLKSYDWYKQNPAISKLNGLNRTTIDISTRFLLGRNLLQTAIGGEFAANAIFNNLSNWLDSWFNGKENHVLNGILYEMYFYSEGKFRRTNFKSGLIDKIFELEENKKFAKSFVFIHNQLEPFRDFLFYLPSTSPVTLPVDILLKEVEDEDFMGENIKKKYLESIKIHGTEVMNTDTIEKWYTTATYNQFIDKLHFELCVPIKRLRISINEQDKQNLTFQIPMDRLLKK